MTTSRYIATLLIAACAFISCKKDNHEANALLSKARSLYTSGNYGAAKIAIDSISKIAPKAFTQINAGLDLLDSIRYGENIQIINLSDTALKQIEPRIELQKALFSFEINRKYQEKGTYIPKAYPRSLTTAQTGLRSGVDEEGRIFLESVSDRSTKHFAVEGTTADGLKSQTLPVVDDGANYRFRLLGGKNVEVVRYAGKFENGLAAFIVANRAKNITITLKGKSSFSFALPANAKKGIVDSYTLSRLINEKDTIRFRMEKSKLLIKYLDEKRAKAITTKAENQLKKQR